MPTTYPAIVEVQPRHPGAAHASRGSRRPVRGRGARLVIAAGLALVLTALGGTVTSARSPVQSAAASGARAPAIASSFGLDLYRRGDFVAQTNLVQCVGASIQMMMNMVAPTNDRSASTQRRVFKLAKAYSDRVSPRPGRKGASVRGWAMALDELGYGPYRVMGYDTLPAAIHAAARAIRVTGRPVGLLMWHGRHAWVMSGFRASADPLATDTFTVMRVTVLDPLYPRASPTWGASPAPGTELSLAALGRDFVRRGLGWDGVLAGPYVIVQPVVLPSMPPGARPS